MNDIVIDKDGEELAAAIGKLLRDSGQTLATAESCTGGMIGELITAVAGSSDYYLGGIVAYSNATKCDLLAVDSDLLETHGAVSEEVAAAMATGARERFGSDWAISVTGVAGPGGGSEDKPVGLVYIGLAGPDGCDVHRHDFTGTRQNIRRQSTLTALNHLKLKLTSNP